ncbi:Fic family protein [Runella sp.]|uniref:Fic family protein n=1 Tax=Runella sp. TaxID=1960881 RepID=UPI003D148D08
MEFLKKAIELKAELDKLRPINKEKEAVIMDKFRLDWNYHSNKIEGNSLTYGETKALILFGITAQGKPLKDHFEITGHNEAIKWVEELVHQEVPVTENFIRQLHKLLLKEPYEVEAITSLGERTKKLIQVGSYKNTPNHVLTKTGEIFRFATPEETPSKMYDLIVWLRNKQADNDLNPIVLAAEFHYRFIRIHPFDDGNGRIARILMNLILMQNGFPPIIIKTEDKASYYSVLQQADAGILEPFFEYIAQNTVRSLETMIRGAKGESVEEPDDLDKELALLERKLKGEIEQIKSIKNRGEIRGVYSHSLKILFNELMIACEKFRRFYRSINYAVILNENLFQVAYDVDIQGLVITEPNGGIKDIKLMISNNIDSLSFVCSFSDFKQIETKELVYETRIDVYFKSNIYLVGKYKKAFLELLTEAEIQTITTNEFKKHKEFIEAKIREIQKNAGN